MKRWRKCCKWQLENESERPWHCLTDCTDTANNCTQLCGCLQVQVLPGTPPRLQALLIKPLTMMPKLQPTYTRDIGTNVLSNSAGASADGLVVLKYPDSTAASPHRVDVEDASMQPGVYLQQTMHAGNAQILGCM